MGLFAMDVRLLAPDVATLLDVPELAMLPRSALDTSVGGGKMAATYRVTVSCAGISPEEAAAGIPAILEVDKRGQSTFDPKQTLAMQRMER
jgi:hypothetical protein